MIINKGEQNKELTGNYEELWDLRLIEMLEANRKFRKLKIEEVLLSQTLQIVHNTITL